MQSLWNLYIINLGDAVKNLHYDYQGREILIGWDKVESVDMYGVYPCSKMRQMRQTLVIFLS